MHLAQRTCFCEYVDVAWMRFSSFLAKPTSHKWRSDKNDLSKIYDSATPNPTGSLSGPWVDIDWSGNVTGVAGRISFLACRIKNLANQTVSHSHYFPEGFYYNDCRIPQNQFAKTTCHAGQVLTKNPLCFKAFKPGNLVQFLLLFTYYSLYYLLLLTIHFQDSNRKYSVCYQTCVFI